jgi:iron complex transport system substrate-binding protein
MKENFEQIKCKVLLLSLVGFFLIVSCGKNQNQNVAKNLDSQNHELASRNFERIICASPGITEIVFALGCEDRVVGMSQFTDYLPQVEGKAEVGGWLNPNKEMILKLKPDLVIIQGRHESLSQFCRQNGIQVISFTLENLNDILEAIVQMGDFLDAHKAAEYLSNQINQELELIHMKTCDLPRRKVFLTFGHIPGDLSGLSTVSAGTFLHELVVIAGGRNIFADATGNYPRISKETLVVRQPEVIIEFCPGGLSPSKRKRMEMDWEKFSLIPAVKDQRIYFFTDDYLLIPGVRIIKTARLLFRAIHPEVYIEKDSSKTL